MTCERYLEMMSAGLDGELTEAEICELDTHLSECPRCRELSETMKSQADQMPRDTVPRMPERLRSRIRRELRLERPRHEMPAWYIGDPLRMPAVTKKTSKCTILLMGPWGRTG